MNAIELDVLEAIIGVLVIAAVHLKPSTRTLLSIVIGTTCGLTLTWAGVHLGRWLS